jgi:hypothetical protein
VRAFVEIVERGAERVEQRRRLALEVIVSRERLLDLVRITRELDSGLGRNESKASRHSADSASACSNSSSVKPGQISISSALSIVLSICFFTSSVFKSFESLEPFAALMLHPARTTAHTRIELRMQRL